MKKLFKKTIFFILNFFSFFIKIKKIDSKNLNIIILLRKPLGIGDLVMLSPFIFLVEKKFDNIFIVSEYDEFLLFKKSKWIKPNSLDDNLLNNSLVISPTLAFSHLKYMFKSKYFLGYFTSNKLISNIVKINYRYNPKKEHYLKKTFPLMDILEIEYDKDNFIYPEIKCNEYRINNNYITIAPYSNWMERQYPFNNYIELIFQLLKVTNINIILIGSNNDDEKKFNKKIEKQINNNRVINLTGKTNILQMNHIIKNSKLFIGNDSGPANISYIISPKSLVFFGSVYFENRLPLNPLLSKNIKALDKRGNCQEFPCYDGYNKPFCKNSDKYCCLNVKISDKQLLSLLS